MVPRVLQEIWEQSNAEQVKLAIWLRDMEREQCLLFLKYVANIQ